MFKMLMLVCALTFSFGAAAVEECEGVSTAEILKCLGDQYQSADDALNEIYQDLRENCLRDDGKGFRKLQNAQRAWITYRDLNCEWAGHAMAGGTGENILRLSCLTHMTEQRAEELNEDKQWCDER